MGPILCPECETSFLSWSKDRFFVCDNCGFRVDVNGDPFGYLRKKAKEIEVGTKQPMPQLRIHQPLQTWRTPKQKQNMAKKKTAVLHAKNNRVTPKQNGQPFFLFHAPTIQYC